MFLVKCGEDEYVVDSWDEIQQLFNETVWALGAVDAKIEISYLQ